MIYKEYQEQLEQEQYRLECFARSIITKYGNRYAVREWLKERERKAKCADLKLREVLKQELDLFESRTVTERQMQFNNDDLELKRELAK